MARREAGGRVKAKCCVRARAGGGGVDCEAEGLLSPSKVLLGSHICSSLTLSLSLSLFLCLYQAKGFHTNIWLNILRPPPSIGRGIAHRCIGLNFFHGSVFG